MGERADQPSYGALKPGPNWLDWESNPLKVRAEKAEAERDALLRAGEELVRRGDENNEGFDWLLHSDSTDEGSPDGYHTFTPDDTSNIECERRRWKAATESWRTAADSIGGKDG